MYLVAAAVLLHNITHTAKEIKNHGRSRVDTSFFYSFSFFDVYKTFDSFFILFFFFDCRPVGRLDIDWISVKVNAILKRSPTFFFFFFYFRNRMQQGWMRWHRPT
jgi:hypothetical protein